MGLSVICLTDNAAPPLESPSNLVNTTPVKGNASPNALAVFTASCPCIASTTNKVSIGARVLCNCLISFIIISSIPKRPAVSKITTSKRYFLAKSNVAIAILFGLSLGDESKQSTFKSSAKVFS